MPRTSRDAALRSMKELGMPVFPGQNLRTNCLCTVPEDDYDLQMFLSHRSRAMPTFRGEAFLDELTEDCSDRRERLVVLHVYDVSRDPRVQHVNQVLAHENGPVKLGGIFHSGIEIDGLEWSFGRGRAGTTGVRCDKPRACSQHNYRQTVILGSTDCSPEKVAQIIGDLVEEYQSDSYELLRRNCCHFTQDFSRRLGLSDFPQWVIRLANVAARLDSFLDGPLHEYLPW